jgi:hypothetical protein
MPLVVVEGGTLKCSHQAQARLPSGDARLAVSGNGAVTLGMEVGIAFPTCPFKDPKSGSPSPCSATMAATAGSSGILAVGNRPVLLDTAGGIATNPSDPSATWSVADAGQQLLSVDG